jgi:hypothetical protein
MHPLHVIVEIIPPWKPIARDRPLAIGEAAEIGFGAMSVHTMSLTLVSQKASSGGKLGAIARSDLTLVGAQMRVNVFAVQTLARKTRFIRTLETYS